MVFFCCCKPTQQVISPPNEKLPPRRCFMIALLVQKEAPWGQIELPGLEQIQNLEQANTWLENEETQRRIATIAKLSFYGNPIVSLPQDVVTYCKNITYLDLRDTQVPLGSREDIFRQLPTLQELQIGGSLYSRPSQKEEGSEAAALTPAERMGPTTPSSASSSSRGPFFDLV